MVDEIPTVLNNTTEECPELPNLNEKEKNKLDLPQNQLITVKPSNTRYA